MKKQIHIPNRKSISRRFKSPPQKEVYIEEKKPLGEICKEKGLDMTRMTKLVNLAFLLSDVMESLVLDVETELKKADPLLSLELRHPISRMKIHTREMVRFVDKTMKNDDASSDFGDKADTIREMLENYFN